MNKKWLEYLKESGLFGNLVAAIIIWLIGLLVTLLSNISALKYNVAFSIPLFVIIGSILILSGIVYLLYKIISNPIRQYSSVFGYYRKLYHSLYYPYLKDGDRYYTKVKKIVEYRVSRDGITKIEPFEFYAYKPRGSDGEEKLHNISVTTLLNGRSNILYTEQSLLGTDGCSITIISNKPLKSKDVVYFCVEYMQYGLNAPCQEELDDYKKIPDL